jgi:hypothetical protein
MLSRDLTVSGSGAAAVNRLSWAMTLSIAAAEIGS